MRKSPRKAAQVKTEKNTDVEENKQKLLVVPVEVVNNKHTNGPVLTKLRHPKTCSGAQFLFTPDDKNVCELVKFSEEPRSWFVGNYVQKDGSIFICTKVDPLLLILPYLEKTDKFMLLDQVVTDNSFPECDRLLKCEGIKNIASICDEKKCGGDSVYRLNLAKIFDWLKRKVDRVSSVLEDQGTIVTSGSTVATFVRSKKDEKPGKDVYVKYAFELVAEYLSEDLTEKLRTDLNIKKEEPLKRPAPSESETLPSIKKQKKNLKPDEPLEDYSNKSVKKTLKVVKLTATQKALSKVDKSGMKSISSFFSKSS